MITKPVELLLHIQAMKVGDFHNFSAEEIAALEPMNGVPGFDWIIANLPPRFVSIKAPEFTRIRVRSDPVPTNFEPIEGPQGPVISDDKTEG